MSDEYFGMHMTITFKKAKLADSYLYNNTKIAGVGSTHPHPVF